MKKLWVLSVAATCFLYFNSCGNSTITHNSPATDDSVSMIASLKQEIAQLQKRISELEGESSNLQTSKKNTITDNTKTISYIEISPTIMELNSTVTVGDVMDITITGAEWSDSILPSDTSEFYTYYEGNDIETYFVVHGTITSYAGNSFDIQWNSESSILINGKYTFLSTMEFEDLDGRGFGESIKPLQTRNFIIYSSVSDEVYNISKTVQVSFKLPDNEEELNYFYDENHSNASYTILFQI